jgi:hypothetical protein
MSHQDQEAGQGMADPKGRRLVTLWTAAMASMALVAGVVISMAMYNNRASALRIHQERMDPAVLESGLKEDEAKLPATAHPTQVTTGIYVDRIPELKIKESNWTVDCYIWFRWKGNEIHPGENFQVVGGWIEERQKVDEYVSGDEHYERYRVVAKITKSFDVRRFPMDEHLLTINIEHPAYKRAEVIFVPDTSSSVSSRVQVVGYRIAGSQIVEKPHAYSTTLGDPRLPKDFRAVHSQFRMGIDLKRDGWGFFFKLFQGLLASLALAMVAFFIRPTDLDPRFGLGVGAFFASIASTYITSSLIPDTGVMTLADILNGIGMVTIFMTTVQSVVSLRVYETERDEALSKAYDRVSFWVFLLIIAGLGLVVPAVAAG